MGYQVGNTCYADRQLAENAYFSQAVPVVTGEGVKQVSYSKGSWYYGSQKLTAYLPECSPLDNFVAGAEFGMWLLPTAVVLMSAKLIIRLFQS